MKSPGKWTPWNCYVWTQTLVILGNQKRLGWQNTPPSPFPPSLDLKLRTINTWASYLVQSVFYPKWFVSLRASKIRKRGFRVRETILSIHGFLWYDNTRRWAILQPPKNWNISEFKRKHSETLCQRNISTDQWFTIDLEVIIINITSTISCGIFGKIYFSTL